uniref:Exostosin-like glycosyltransferase n=1 Tax=Tetraselmis sp. GSL018 TaxID=582737 RepID=A0A061RCH4_9CHLO
MGSIILTMRTQAPSALLRYLALLLLLGGKPLSAAIENSGRLHRRHGRGADRNAEPGRVISWPHSQAADKEPPRTREQRVLVNLLETSNTFAENQDEDPGSNATSGSAAGRPFPQVFIYELRQACESVGIYSLERTLPLHLRQTPYYTADIASADLFLVPAQPYCNRPEGSVTSAEYIERVLEEEVRPLGRWDALRHRHVWVFSADHGFCGTGGKGIAGVPAIRDSIILSHWGLTHPENAVQLNQAATRTFSQPTGPDALPCHVPGKDLVVPPDLNFRALPHGCEGLGQRDIQLLFYGSSGLGKAHQGLHYSHGVRQAAFLMFGDRSKYPNFRFYESGGTPEDMYRARFCLAPSGGGFGNRLYFIMAHGCIPVIIQPDIAQPWEELLDYDGFAVVLEQHTMHRLPRMLDEIESKTGLLQKMQAEVCRVAPYFSWEWNGARGKAMEALMQVLASRIRGKHVTRV